MFVLFFLVGCATVEVTKPSDEEPSESPSETEQKEETPAPAPEPQPQIEETPKETEPVEEEPEEEPEEQIPDVIEVTIGKGKFDPAEVTIKVGEAVTWTNLYEASIMLTGPKGTFSTKLGGGESYSYTFEEPGMYNIIKVVDPILFGKVFVEE